MVCVIIYVVPVSEYCIPSCRFILS